eukprot:EG_transcript_18950
MRALGVAGIVLQVYGPFLVVFVLYLRRYPQLCLLTIVGGFYYVLATILPALLRLATANPWVVLPLSAGLQEVAWAGLYVLVSRLLQGFAAKNMPLYSSRLGILPVAFVMGLGFGAAQSLLQLGSLLSFETAVPLSGWYDPDQCPGLPFTYAQALVAFCFLYLHPCWGMATFWAYSRLGALGSTLTDILQHPRSAWHPAAVLVLTWLSHVGASLLTLSPCDVSLPGLFALLVLNGGLAYHLCERQAALASGPGY